MPGVLATLATTTMVGAAGGWAAWSEPAPGGGYALVARAPDGTTARPVIAPRGVPFDVDLGIDAAGRVVAANTRCSRAPLAAGGANPRAGGGLPQYTSGGECSIRLLDLVSGVERRVPRYGASEVLPSLAGRTLAAIAVPRGRPGRHGAALTVRVLGGRPRRLWTGRRAAAATGAAEGPTSIDTDGRRVTSAWRHANRRDGSFDSDVLVQGLGAKRPTFANSATNTEDTPYVTALAPTLARGGVVYVLSFGGHGFCSRRFAAAGRAPSYGLQHTSDPATPVSAALDGDRLVVAETAGTQTQVVEYAQSPFTRYAAPGEFCG
jgi:hypothetical protein